MTAGRFWSRSPRSTRELMDRWPPCRRVSVYTHRTPSRGVDPTAMCGNGLATPAVPPTPRRRRQMPPSRIHIEDLMETIKEEHQVMPLRLRRWLDHTYGPQFLRLMEDSWTKSCLGPWKSGTSFLSCFIVWWWITLASMEPLPVANFTTSPAQLPCATRPLDRPSRRLWLQDLKDGNINRRELDQELLGQRGQSLRWGRKKEA